jgi:hypothetical protein
VPRRVWYCIAMGYGRGAYGVYRRGHAGGHALIIRYKFVTVSLPKRLYITAVSLLKPPPGSRSD